jgi:hypothetical protein
MTYYTLANNLLRPCLCSTHTQPSLSQCNMLPRYSCHFVPYDRWIINTLQDHNTPSSMQAEYAMDHYARHRLNLIRARAFTLRDFINTTPRNPNFNLSTDDFIFDINLLTRLPEKLHPNTQLLQHFPWLRQTTCCHTHTRTHRLCSHPNQATQFSLAELLIPP